MSHLSSIDSSRASRELTPQPKDSPKVKEFDPKEILVLDRWQDYVFFGAMFITTCTIAKRILNGNITGTVSNTWTLSTIVMGKIYTDDALDKYSLGLVAKSMECHVNVLEQQVSQFSQQLEENRVQLALLGHEVDVFVKGNKQHEGLIRGYEKNLRDYKETLQEHQQAVRQIERDILEGNTEKERLQKQLEELEVQLRETTLKLNQARDELLRAVAQATPLIGVSSPLRSMVKV